MSKGLGQKIGIKFTEDLVGDVSGKGTPIPYSFYRWYITSTWVSSGRLYLYELEFFSNGTKVNTNKIISMAGSSRYSSSYDVDRLFDGSVPGREWDANGSLPHWVSIELDEAIVIDSFRWHTGTSSNKPKEFILQGSNDGINWVDIYKDESPNLNNWIDFAVNAGNEIAFTVTGKEYQYVNGPLVDKEYRVERVERYPIPKVWIGNLSIGSFTDTIFEKSTGLVLGIDESMIQDIFIDIGSSGSSSSYEMPYQSYYYKNKVQFLLTEAELESFDIKKGQLIHALHLKSTAQPSRNLTNFRIRIGQTDNDILTTWVKDNLTLVYEGTVLRTDLVAGTTKKYDFISPYVIGDGNLLIEVSRDETTGSKSGAMGTRTGFTSGKMIGWRADSGASFPFDNVAATPFDYILDVSLTVEKRKYKASGTYITPVIPKNKPLRIMWLEDKPIGTNIVVEYKEQTNGEWIGVENSQIINGNSDINLKVTLSTDDITVSPTLQNLWLEEPEAPADQIRLVMHPQSRFNNVESPLTVQYDQTVGSLRGRGGAVESFEVSFTPEDLVQKPNPHAAETVTVKPEIELQFLRVEYRDRFEQDTMITAVPSSISVEFINVSEINP